MSSARGLAHSKIVGAPTFPQWKSVIADTHTRHSPVAPGTETLTAKEGERQNLATGQNSGHSKNVGAPTFLASLSAVRP
jgi:hypothetical protein